MGYPEYILLAFYVISLANTLRRHGQRLKMTWITIAIQFTIPALLIWGGFFSSFGVPQVIYTMMWALVTGYVIIEREKKLDAVHDFYSTVVVIALMMGLYWWGGFFA